MNNCEVCGVPAQYTIQDTQEQRPTQDENGKYWFASKPWGAPHYYCHDHLRKSVTIPWTVNLNPPPAVPPYGLKELQEELKDLEKKLGEDLK